MLKRLCILDKTAPLPSDQRWALKGLIFCDLNHCFMNVGYIYSNDSHLFCESLALLCVSSLQILSHEYECHNFFAKNAIKNCGGA